MPAFWKKSCAALAKLLAFTLIWWGCCFVVSIPRTGVQPALPPETEAPEPEEIFVIDTDNLNNGYFRAKHAPCSGRLKIRVVKDDIKYTYDLNNAGMFETFPLQMGSGTYTCIVYMHVRDNLYAKESEVTLEAELDNEFVPYLNPNQYVYYTPEYRAVAESMLLCKDLQTDAEKYDAIVDYISQNFQYDYERAASNPGFYLGDVDGCLETRTGLCQDLAALTACMLRVQEIPCQMVIGYADEYYHAWNKAFIDGEYRLLDITAEITGGHAKVYTEHRCY